MTFIFRDLCVLYENTLLQILLRTYSCHVEEKNNVTSIKTSLVHTSKSAECVSLKFYVFVIYATVRRKRQTPSSQPLHNERLLFVIKCSENKKNKIIKKHENRAEERKADEKLH